MNSNYLKTIIQLAKDKIPVGLRAGMTDLLIVDLAHVMMAKITMENPLNITGDVSGSNGEPRDFILDKRLSSMLKIDKAGEYQFIARGNDLFIKGVNDGVDMKVGSSDYFTIPKLPDIKQSVYFNVDYEDLYDTVSMIKKLSDHLLLKIENEVLSVIVSDFNEDNPVFKKDIAVKYISGSDGCFKSMFPVDYMLMILKQNVAGISMKMGLSTNYPVSFEYDICDGELGKGSVYTLLAPRIEAEED